MRNDAWWLEAFANRTRPSEACGHPCGAHEMLMIVSYDIADPRRLQRVAKHCEDYGVRIQFSVFECRMPKTRFDRFWTKLTSLIEDAEDRIVAFRICETCAEDVRTAGTMELPQPLEDAVII